MNRSFLLALGLAQLLTSRQLSGQTTYFPANAVSLFEADWFGKHLKVMRERALHRSTSEAYRFLWLRTFHAPVAVRLGAVADSGYVVLTVLTGQGGYDPGAIDRRDSTALSKAAWQEIQSQLMLLGFWTLSEHDPPDRVGMDGAEWILEGYRSGKYRLVQRWSPGSGERDAAFRAVCLRMLSAAGYDPIAGSVY